MGETLDRLMQVVLHDIAVTGAPEPRVEDSDWQGVEDSESAMLWVPDGSGAGVWIEPGLPRAEALARLADRVQEWVIEELARTLRPTNWPPCKDHPRNHPMLAATQDGVAVWTCPADGHAHDAIGSLESRP